MSTSHSIIVIENDLDENNENVKSDIDDKEENGNEQLDVSSTVESLPKKVSLVDLSSSSSSSATSASIPLRWKSAAHASVNNKDSIKQGTFPVVTLKDHLATKLGPSNPLMASFSATPKTLSLIHI